MVLKIFINTNAKPHVKRLNIWCTVADLGGDGGMHPPHQPKPNDFVRKISLNFGEDPFFLFFIFLFLEATWFWAEKTFEFPISAEKSVSISEKTFFFFFWRPPDFGRKKPLNFWALWGFVLKIFIIPPHQWWNWAGARRSSAPNFSTTTGARAPAVPRTTNVTGSVNRITLWC